MKIQKLTISNFGSFLGTHVIPMTNQGLVFVRGENLDEPKSPSNGAGKSTIFDALDWGLFGEVPRGDSAKSIVNEEAKKDCWVLVQLLDGDTMSLVFRYRQLGKESGVKLFQATGDHWDNRTALDVDKTQERINEVLGLDRTVFKAAVYRAQGDSLCFAEATDGERKELLTALIPELQEVDALKEIAREKFQKETQHIIAISTEALAIAKEQEALKATDWDSAEASWVAQMEAKYQQAQKGREAAITQLLAAQQFVAQRTQAEANLDQIKGTPPVMETTWQAEYDSRVAARGQAATKVATLQAQYQQLQNEITPFQKGTVTMGPCSRCKQIVTGEHLQKEMARIQQLMLPVVVEGKAARAALEAHEAHVAEAAECRKQEAQANQGRSANHGSALAAANAHLQQIISVENQIPQLAAQLTNWDAQLHTLQHEVWPGAQQKQDAAARISVLAAKIADLNEAQEAGTQRAKLFAFWTDGLSAKGLKNLIMDSRIEEMTAAANLWVQAVTGGTTWVRFETQTLNQAGKLSEKMNIRIFRHNPDGTITERNFKSWSGGEKTRVALGTDQGLAKLIADRATKSWDLLILDEAFSRGLDGGGREAVFDQVQKLQGGTVFVVDHTDLGAYFENVWTVRIQNRRSQVFIGGVSCQVEPNDPKMFLPSGL